MNETMTREERLSALDDFAAAGPAPTTQLPVVTTIAPPPSLVHGAQPIAGALRDPRGVLQELTVTASMMGEDAYYSIPFKDRKKGTTTYVEGLSIKGAMAMIGCIGNVDVDCYISAEGMDWIEITARTIDLEKGIAVTRPFRQRMNASRIGGDSDQRNREAALQIGVSKAERNVIINAFPAFASFMFEEAKNSLVNRIGTGASLDNWRRKIGERLIEMGIALPRVEAVIGRKVSDMLAPDIAKVVALGKAISDGMAAADETFPPLGGEEPDERERMNAQLDQIASGPTDPVKAATGEPPSSSHEPDTATGDQRQTAPVAVREKYMLMVQQLLQTATAFDRDEEYKLEQLELSRGWWEDQLPLDWHHKIKTAIVSAAKVARGQLGIDDARKYLTAL